MISESAKLPDKQRIGKIMSRIKANVYEDDMNAIVQKQLS